MRAIALACGVGATLTVASTNNTLSPRGNQIAMITLFSAVAMAAGGAGLIAVRRVNRRLHRELRRKQTVQRLNQGLAERFALVMRQVNDAILLLDEQGRILEANDCALTTYRYSLAELRALPAGGLQAMAVPIGRERGSATANGGMLETRHRRKDGSTFPVLARTSTSEIDGEKLRLLVCRDITDREQLEQLSAKREIDACFRVTFEGAGIGMALVDMQGHPVQSNQALQHMLGYSADELAGMVFTEFTHPEDRGRDWHLYQGLVDGQRDRYELEKRYLRKDGTILWGSLTVSLIRDARGQPIFAVGALQDVTERRQVDEYRAQLAAIVESSNDAIVGQGLDGVIRSWNGGAERLFGYKRREAIGQSIAIVSPPDRAEEERITLARIAMGETIEPRKAVGRRKGGELIDVFLNVSPIRDAAGTITGASTCARKIPEREPTSNQA